MLLSALLLGVLVTEAFLFFLIGRGWVNSGASFYLVIGALLFAACAWRSFLVLVTFALSGGFRGRKLIPAFKTVAGEILVVLYLYSYAQVFLPTAYKIRTWLRFRMHGGSIAPNNGPVIVLVHGFVCNSGLWGAMIRHLRDHGFTRVHAVNLEPFYRSMPKSLIEFEAQLSSILHLEKAQGEVILIGHSMGGVLARVFQNHHPERVLAAISIGAPHAGTDLARLVSTINAGPARPDTRWLVEFNAAIAAEQKSGAKRVGKNATEPRPALNIWSDSDNIVYPQGNAALSSDVDCRLNGLGHLHLAFSERALNPITDFLRKLGNS